MVALDAPTIAVLREQKKRQAEERLQMGAAWIDLGLVFCRADGTPCTPSVSREASPSAFVSLGYSRSAYTICVTGGPPWR